MRRLAHAWCFAFVVLLLGQTTVPIWHHHDDAGAACAHADHACPSADDDRDGDDDHDGDDDCAVCRSLAAGKHATLAAPPPRVVAVATVGIDGLHADLAVVQIRRFGRPHPRGPPIDS